MHMGLLYLCDYYATPQKKKNLFPLSLTTISITCFLCPSKEGTKSMHGNILCEKIIVIYNVHTLPYRNTQKYFWKAEQVNERKWHNSFSVVCPKSPRFMVLKFINQWKFELNWGRDKEVTAFWNLAITWGRYSKWRQIVNNSPLCFEH